MSDEKLSKLEQAGGGGGAESVLQCMNRQALEIIRLRAEVERLRAALEEIASGKYSGIVLTSFPPQDPAVNRARAALNPPQEPRT